MGLRTFLKNTARALGLGRSSSRSSTSHEVNYAIALPRIEKQIAEAAASRDSIKLLDLWHELSLWKAPPKKAGELKEHLAHLFKEFEGQSVNPNVSSSTLLVLRSQVSNNQARERRQAEEERQAREAEATRLAREEEAQRQADIQRQLADWARQKAESDRLKLEQEQQASSVDSDEDIPPIDPDELAAVRHELRGRIDAVRETLQERQTQSAVEDAWAEDFPPQDLVPGGAKPLHDPGLDLEPLAEDVVLQQGEQTGEAPSSDESQEKPSWPKIPIGDLSLSIRASNALHNGGFRTVADLAEKRPDDLLNIRNFGKKSLDELIVGLEKQGIPFPVPPTQQPDRQETQAATSNQVKKTSLPSATTALRDLGIPQPVLGPLLRSGMKTLEDLAGKSASDLAKIRNLGPIGIERLRQALAGIGLELPFSSRELNSAAFRQTLRDLGIALHRQSTEKPRDLSISDVENACATYGISGLSDFNATGCTALFRGTYYRLGQKGETWKFAATRREPAGIVITPIAYISGGSR